MDSSNITKNKLWLILAGLALAIVLVIALDFFPTAPNTPAESGADTEISAETKPETNPDSGDTHEVILSGDPSTFSLTFVGECAPGSPFGTDAYGSFNALAADVGTAYFFSEIAHIFSEDDFTVAVNRCVFSDEITAECAAPYANASMFADASVELILNHSPALDEYTVHAALPIQNTGVNVIKNDTFYTREINGIPVTFLTARLTGDNTDELTARITEAKKSVAFLALCFYGGETSSHIPEDWMTEALHACADAGADLIVGTGPGVLRPTEIYNETPIAYSLGTLLDGTQIVPENATAIMQCTVHKDADGTITTDVAYLPAYVYTDLWKPALMTEEAEVDLVLDFLAGETAMPIDTPAN